LLKLDAIAGHGRQSLSELQVQDHSAPLELAAGKSDHFAYHLVQIHRLGHRGLVGKQRAQAAHHFRGAMGVPDRAAGRLARAFEVGRLGGQHPQAGPGVRDDARQRVVDLVGDGGCQRAERGDP
jgi:hypothetical protein